MDDCPPGYYDIYPHECIPLSSLAKATPPNNAPPPLPPTTSTTTTNNNTVTPSVPSNGNAVVSQPSSSQCQPRNNEVSNKNVLYITCYSNEVAYSNTNSYIKICRMKFFDFKNSVALNSRDKIGTL